MSKTKLTVRILSETPNEPNRKQRRHFLTVRTSPTIRTKKHTLGRVSINNLLVVRGSKQVKGNGLKMLDLPKRK